MLLFQQLQSLWSPGMPLAKAKLVDIKSYLYIIPIVGYPFYVKLIGDDTIEEDVDGYKGEVDFQIEKNEEKN